MGFKIETVATASIQCEDYVYFNSREENRMKETLPLLHNVALQYALKNVTAPSYRIRSFMPTYVDDFKCARHPLYIYPAVPVKVDIAAGAYMPRKGYQPNTVTSVLKIGWQDDAYRTFTTKTSKNILQFSDIKIIDPCTTFATFITSSLSFQDLVKAIPPIIRLGKLSSKASVTLSQVKFVAETKKGQCNWLLNPVDLPPGLKIGRDYVASITRMNPNDLIHDVHFSKEIPMISILDCHIALPVSYHFQALGVGAT
nr:type I-D CRISPR-associated protein Cas5/Csc1 [Candidatus Sigynarchaeum springense]